MEGCGLVGILCSAVVGGLGGTVVCGDVDWFVVGCSVAIVEMASVVGLTVVGDSVL